MKNVIPATLCLALALSACNKKTELQDVAETENTPAPYDTIPVDSFATGANPEFLQRKEDSVRQMFLDSVNAVKAKETEVKNKEKEKKEADGTSDKEPATKKKITDTKTTSDTPKDHKTTKNSTDPT